MMNLYGAQGNVTYSEKLVGQYHASMHDEDLEEVSQQFIPGNFRCIVATVAYGMGVDVDDIDLVVHWGESGTILNLWQEIGRGGRRGQPAQAYIYHRGTAQRDAEEDMKTLINDAKEKNIRCLRKSILKCLVIEGMTPPPVPPAPCGQKSKCEDCSCAACNCCFVCHERCK